MAGYIAEFFGYKSEDGSKKALSQSGSRICPFTHSTCSKLFAHGKKGIPNGVCAVRQKSKDSPDIICCPNRIYADDYKILSVISEKAFGKKLKLCAGKNAVDVAKKDGGAIAVFGHGWGGELHLPKRKGTGSYFVDWVLARLDENANLVEFTAIEVQTIDTTGNYQTAYSHLNDKREVVSDSVGLNWENVNKRIIPQLIYKGQVLQREDLCKTGLYFVCPKAIYDKVIERLGGKEKLPQMPTQPASIHFFAYDYYSEKSKKGQITPLKEIEEYCTAVYKVQEAFSSVSLPDGNVYKSAILKSLGIC
ncbi:MAG: hypothetical protein J6X95_07735 [Treponema sp.]|nr:hypothetical protein [Treponema sp.]